MPNRVWRKYCANGGRERCYEYVGVFQVRNLVLVECYDWVPDRQEYGSKCRKIKSCAKFYQNNDPKHTALNIQLISIQMFNWQ